MKKPNKKKEEPNYFGKTPGPIVLHPSLRELHIPDLSGRIMKMHIEAMEKEFDKDINPPTKNP